MISKNTLDFLHENCFRNDRTWYQEHKEEFQKLVLEPLKQLVIKLEPTMKEIDPLLITDAKVDKTISRVYRDTRFSKDKSLYRDVMWIVFLRKKKQAFMSMPGFYFEFSPNGWRFGLGYYNTPTKVMAAMREMILSGDRFWKKAFEAFSNQDIFEIAGDRYKRPRYSDQPAELQQWLELRNIYFVKNSEDFELLYSDDLYKTLADGFLKLKPIYEFMMRAEEIAEIV